MAGARVIDSTAANDMAKVLVKAKGLNKRPSIPSKVNIGKKAMAMTSREKKEARPTSLAEEINISW